ncbi:outer membrane protein assembly factor BamB [Acinetobacter soli]|uniref:Outer membrane protein assembly factor BamB n=1 Tax=Acinetobacter soli NIPH 2899 TaxID=1217677 RepID=A0ABN0K002_9GAMM|nr:outer membrane protein assembly factor BamB [Acinetobacter soli]ENV61134.1 outer membrane assembly lipoprotein YfgL [Acinetobacter soli NIPH 2899]
MDIKYKFPFALMIVSAALVGCSTNKLKKEEAKPNPLPKLAQTQTQALVPVFSQRVSSMPKADPLRLQLDNVNGVIFVPDPKGKVSAYRGKDRLWTTRVTKHRLTAGTVAGEGIVVVGTAKGELFALDQQTGEQKWKVQLSGAVLSPSLIYQGRVTTIANDGTVFAHDAATGQQVWTYKMPSIQFSLRGQPSPVMLDDRTVVAASANGYVYGIDVISGIPRFQRRVAVSEGRSDVQRLIDIDGDPVVSGQYLVTVSYQGQVTVTDLTNLSVVWNQDSSSNKRPAVYDNKVFISQSDGKLSAFDLGTGSKLWESDVLLNRQLSNPVMLGKDLVVGDLDGVIHLINPNSGQLIGRAKTRGEVSSLRVLDGHLYTSTAKGALTIWEVR